MWARRCEGSHHVGRPTGAVELPLCTAWSRQHCQATSRQAVILPAFLKAKLLHRYSVAPCQGSGCIFSTYKCPQPGRRSTIELASPASLGRDTTKGRVELPWLAVIQVFSRPATSGGATNGGGCRVSRPRGSCNAMAKKEQPTQLMGQGRGRLGSLA